MCCVGNSIAQIESKACHCLNDVSICIHGALVQLYAGPNAASLCVCVCVWTSHHLLVAHAAVLVKWGCL